MLFRVDETPTNEPIWWTRGIDTHQREIDDVHHRRSELGVNGETGVIDVVEANCRDCRGWCDRSGGRSLSRRVLSGA
jgi:hypothetical protein